MIPFRIRVVAAAALLAAGLGACDRKPTPPKLAEVMPNLPLPPQAQVVSQAGGEDALQITVVTPLKRTQVETYYRGLLARDAWKLLNEAKDPDGALVLLAEQNGRPLWVRIREATGSSFTLVEFSGARMGGSKPAS